MIMILVCLMEDEEVKVVFKEISNLDSYGESSETDVVQTSPPGQTGEGEAL